MLILNQKNEIKKNIGFVFLFLGLVLTDQVFKYFANNIFLNFNFAFSLQIPKLLMYLVYFIVLAGIIYYWYLVWNKISLFEKIVWVFVFSGAVSNIAERVVFGFVKDFIYIHFFSLTGIYNLADFYIISGVVLLFFIPQTKGKI